MLRIRSTVLRDAISPLISAHGTAAVAATGKFCIYLPRRTSQLKVLECQKNAPKSAHVTLRGNEQGPSVLAAFAIHTEHIDWSPRTLASLRFQPLGASKLLEACSQDSGKETLGSWSTRCSMLCRQRPADHVGGAPTYIQKSRQRKGWCPQPRCTCRPPTMMGQVASSQLLCAPTAKQ